MLTYCLLCRKNTENKDVKMMKTKSGTVSVEINSQDL